MKKKSELYKENKKIKNELNKKYFPIKFSNSIFKFSLAIALLIILSLIVNAGDVVIQAGKLDVSSNLFVDSNGNVGIGTTSPTEKLHVYGNLTVQSGNDIIAEQVRAPSGDFIIRNNADSGSLVQFGSIARFWIAPRFQVEPIVVNNRPITWVNIAGTSNLAVVNLDSSDKVELYGTGASAKMVIQSNGNVGIGTTSPENTLHVSGLTKVSNVVGNILLTLRETTTPLNWNFGTLSDGKFGIAINTVMSGSSFVMDANGNVGIGTTAPTAKLSIIGGVRIGSGAAQANQALCWLSNNNIGYCSSGVGLTGSCTCNAIN